jgi:hypothetical protein
MFKIYGENLIQNKLTNLVLIVNKIYQI